MVRLTDRPDMTLDVYRGRKTTMQQQQKPNTAQQPAIAAIHGPQNLVRSGKFTTRMVTNEKQNRPITICFLKRIKDGLIIEH